MGFAVIFSLSLVEVSGIYRSQNLSDLARDGPA